MKKLDDFEKKLKGASSNENKGNIYNDLIDYIVNIADKKVEEAEKKGDLSREVIESIYVKKAREIYDTYAPHENNA